MTYTIRKSFDFSASHRLDGLPEGHQCSRLHGHNYRVVVELTGPLQEPGFVMDYGDLAPFKKWIDSELDHRHLNDVFGRRHVNPTAENLARLLGEVVESQVPVPPECQVAVGVSETPKTWAWWRP